ncbi:MAG: hypothetical protein ABFC54_03405, partial [Thermoguttaceae bacterium]
TMLWKNLDPNPKHVNFDILRIFSNPRDLNLSKTIIRGLRAVSDPLVAGSGSFFAKPSKIKQNVRPSRIAKQASSQVG